MHMKLRNGKIVKEIKRNKTSSRNFNQKSKSKKLKSSNASNKFSSAQILAISKIAFKKPYFHNFAIPENILFNITKNPSTSKLWQNLIQTCKYFYSKNQIIVVDKLEWTEEEDEDIDYPNGTKNGSWRVSLKEEENLNINFDNIYFKLWIDGDLLQQNHDTSPTLISSIIPKIYRCNLDQLSMNYQKITYNEFTFLTSSKSIDIFDGYEACIIYENGEIVPFEKIISEIPNASSCTWGDNNESPESSLFPSAFTSETAKEMTRLPIFQNLDFLRLLKIPECFDFESLWTFIKAQPYFRKNKKVHDPAYPLIKQNSPFIDLQLANNVSEEYRSSVREILMKSLGSIPKRTRPSITFGFTWIGPEGEIF